MTDRWQQDRKAIRAIFLSRDTFVKRGELARHGGRAAMASPPRYSALILAANRDSLRATVLRCITPLLMARCNSGCASWKADWAAFLSPVSIAVSTFLTKVPTR